MSRLIAAAVFCILLLSGLPAAPAASGVWLDVPFVRQSRDGCGAASIAMVMQYWQEQHGHVPNPDAQYAQIQRKLLNPAANGIYASAMERYLKQSGFETFTFTGDLETLQHHLTKGRPLIVAVRPGRHRPLHYMLVVGSDQANHYVLLNDPAQRKLLKEDTTQFKKEWKATRYWTLLALPATSAAPQPLQKR